MFKKIILFIIISIFLNACVEVGSYIVPGETLELTGEYFIIISNNDERSIHKTLEKSMNSKGLVISSGSREQIPLSADYLVEYGAQWQWDITWYLLDFNIRIYDPETKLLIASANSMRQSFGRKNPEEIVTETLNHLFKD